MSLHAFQGRHVSPLQRAGVEIVSLKIPFHKTFRLPRYKLTPRIDSSDSSNNLGCRDNLAYMTLGVLSRVKEQTQNG